MPKQALGPGSLKGTGCAQTEDLGWGKRRKRERPSPGNFSLFSSNSSAKEDPNPGLLLSLVEKLGKTNSVALTHICLQDFKGFGA